MTYISCFIGWRAVETYVRHRFISYLAGLVQPRTKEKSEATLCKVDKVYTVTDTQYSGLGEDVADLRFEVGVKGSAAEVLSLRATELQQSCNRARRKRNWSCLCCACSTPEAAKRRTVSL